MSKVFFKKNMMGGYNSIDQSQQMWVQMSVWILPTNEDKSRLCKRIREVNWSQLISRGNGLLIFMDFRLWLQKIFYLSYIVILLYSSCQETNLEEDQAHLEEPSCWSTDRWVRREKQTHVNAWDMELLWLVPDVNLKQVSEAQTYGRIIYMKCHMTDKSKRIETDSSTANSLPEKGFHPNLKVERESSSHTWTGAGSSSGPRIAKDSTPILLIKGSWTSSKQPSYWVGLLMTHEKIIGQQKDRKSVLDLTDIQ